MINVDTKWFREMLAERDLSQRRFAHAMQLDPAAMSLLLRGKRNVKLDEAQRMAEILRIPVSIVLAHFGVRALKNENKDGVPLVGIVDEHGLITRSEGEYVARPQEIDEYAVSLYGANNQWVYYVSGTESPIADCVNRLCMAQVKGEAHALLTYIRKGIRGGYTIQNARDIMPQEAEIEHAAPVILIRPL